MAQKLNQDLAFRIETDMDPDELRAQLAKWEPWRIRVEFSNGVSTADLEYIDQFPKNPCNKIARAESSIPFEDFRGGSMLDVGCNVGHNSIYLARKYDLRPVGIDYQPRMLEAASFLSELAGVDGEFLVAHADSFVRPEAFDFILHFGTLYHLPNPLQSLKSAFESLKPGGYLALETLCYDSPDERACYFIHGLDNDETNFFALSTYALHSSLILLGFEAPQECFRIKARHENMFRVCLIARKAESELPRPWLWATNDNAR